jgi:hypothetical protein
MVAPSFNFLPLTLSIETVGGISTPLVRRGTPLPARRTQTFSTAKDNQRAITIQVSLGESLIAANNIVVATCELVDLPETPRGDPQIEVVFEVDKRCKIKITATEKKTGKQLLSEVDAASIDLSPNNIEKILVKTTASINEDRKTVDRIELQNRATNLLDRAEKYLSSSMDKQVDEAVAALGLSLDKKDFTQIAAETNRLEQLLSRASPGPFDFNFGDIFTDLFGSSKPTQKKSAERAHSARSGRGAEDGLLRRQTQSKPGEIVKSDKGLYSTGQYFDAKRMVRDLFADAQSEIIVIDPYVGEDVLALLTVKRSEVAVMILTGKLSPSFLALARDFNRQYKGIEVRSSKTFHDRFLIIDKKDYYHFGASLEHLGNKTFMFSKIVEPSIIESLQNQWNEAWINASRQI